MSVINGLMTIVKKQEACLLDFFWLCFSNNDYLKNLEDTRTGNFLFLFFMRII